MLGSMVYEVGKIWIEKNEIHSKLNKLREIFRKDTTDGYGIV
jgi:hypothetical protein